MKILIYVVVFFIYSALEPFMSNASYAIATTLAYDADTIGLICGALAAARAVFAYCCARWLCKHRHQRQAEKAALAASESPTPVPPPAESEPTIVDLASPAPATPKLRFCKHCGSPLDPATHQCTGCGKQYFRLPVLRKQHLAIVAGALACAAVMFLVVNLVSQKNAAEAKTEELTVRVAELERAVAEKAEQIKSRDLTLGDYMIEIAKKNTEIGELKEENTMYKDLLSFYEENIVFVCSNNPNVYHKFACPYMDAADGIHSYNIQLVDSWGYKPCPHCCG